MFKKNIEKSKKVLKEHFERRKQERRRDIEFMYYSTLKLHKGDNRDTNDEEVDDFTKERDSFYEELIWDDPIKKKEKQQKEIDKNESEI